MTEGDVTYRSQRWLATRRWGKSHVESYRATVRLLELGVRSTASQRVSPVMVALVEDLAPL